MPYFLLEVLIFTTWVHFYDFWDVFLAYLAPSVLGFLLFSVIGRSLMFSLQADFQQGRLPGDRVLQRGAVLVGSILLIIPLFMTRVIALFLIIPGFRHLAVFVFKNYLFKRMPKASFSFQYGPEPRHERDANVVNVTPIE